jgi:hypothetical protein
VAQQFGYEYADVRQGGGRDKSLRMLLVPDPSPHARSRAAHNRVQYPNAGDGVSLPPLVPDAYELLRARISFDLTGNAQGRLAWGSLGVTVGCALLAVRSGGTTTAFTVAGCVWAALMVLLAVGIVVNRHRNAKFAERLRAAGFHAVTEDKGRVRYLPPGTAAPGQQVQAGPYGPGTGGPYGNPQGQPYGNPQGQPYGNPQGQPYGNPQGQPQGTPPRPAPPHVPGPAGPYAGPQVTGPNAPRPPQPYGAQPPFDPRRGPDGQAPQG